MTGGGCDVGPAGFQCWGNFWLGLVILALVLAAFTLMGAAVFSVMRNPGRAVANYGTKRNLIVLAASFIGYMAVLLIVPTLARGARMPFWLELVIALSAFALLAYGLHLVERKPRT